MIDSELVGLLIGNPRTASKLAELTARERQVLQLVAEGLTDRAIAQQLWVAPKTVETHVRHILAKLRLPSDGGHNRRVLAVLAYLRAPQCTRSPEHPAPGDADDRARDEARFRRGEER